MKRTFTLTVILIVYLNKSPVFMAIQPTKANPYSLSTNNVTLKYEKVRRREKGWRIVVMKLAVISNAD
ncbi:hypothetical protein RclHR1_00250005 [Rhizophagus clarus]|uniref:Uncharacterized protein n=1 Tax=Rhizophagus clarus TaxID=94130 RepID=A0A2Z6QYA0_9GLOM|nr:hypothetical protein RclHR1_00250005 [Rhizophagus clarus]